MQRARTQSSTPTQLGSELASSAPVIASASQKVLYIEDNAANMRLVERLLSRRPLVELIPCVTAKIGLELTLVHHPALILLDLHLPDMHGSDVIEHLRSDPLTRDIPVVVLSADATKSEEHRMLAAGARAYFTKPLKLVELLAVVDEVLSGS